MIRTTGSALINQATAEIALYEKAADAVPWKDAES